MNHFPVEVKRPTQEQFDRMISNWVYKKNLPFTIFDQEFQEIISFARPGLHVPGSKAIGGRLLEEEFERVNSNLNYFMTNTSTKFTLGCDGWTDITGQSIINFIAMSRTGSYLISSLNTKDNSHDTGYLVDQISTVINSYRNVYVGLVTDNTTTNISVWNALKIIYPDKFFYGCAAHVYHLLVKDLFQLPSAYKKSDKTPTTFPLYDFVELENKCSELVNALNRGLLKNSLRKKKELFKLKSLKIHGETRWGSLLRMFTEIREWKEPILFPLFGDLIWRAKGTEKVVIWKTGMRNMLHSEKFEETLTAAISILNLIDMRLNSCQSDTICVSDVYHDWMSLKTDVNTLNLPIEQKQYILSQIETRWNFLKSKCHTLAYYLDVKYLGKLMTMNEKMSISELIFSYLVPDNPDNPRNEENKQVFKDKILIELNEFRTSVTENIETISQMSQNKSFSTLTWWQEYSSHFPIISILAIKLFSLVVSTSSVERSFKTQGNIHTKARNKLHDFKCSMLMAIKMNSSLLRKREGASMKIKLICKENQNVNDTQEKEESNFESDSESDPDSDEENLKEVIELEDDSDDN